MKSKSKTTPDSNLSLLLGWGDHMLLAPSVHTYALNWPGTGTRFRHMSPRTPGFVCPIFHIRHPYLVFLDLSIWSSAPGYLTSLPAEWAVDVFLANEMLMLVARVLWPSWPWHRLAPSCLSLCGRCTGKLGCSPLGNMRGSKWSQRSWSSHLWGTQWLVVAYHQTSCTPLLMYETTEMTSVHITKATRELQILNSLLYLKPIIFLNNEEFHLLDDGTGGDDTESCFSFTWIDEADLAWGLFPLLSSH